MYREVAWLQQNHCDFQGRLARSIIRQLSCRAVSVVVDSRAAAAVVGIFVAQAVVFYWCDPCNSFLSLFMHLRNQKRDLEKKLVRQTERCTEVWLTLRVQPSATGIEECEEEEVIDPPPTTTTPSTSSPKCRLVIWSPRPTWRPLWIPTRIGRCLTTQRTIRIHLGLWSIVHYRRLSIGKISAL